MVDKEKQNSVDEPVLNFEDAKEMTIGQAMRKHEDLKAGISEEDGVLDRYIKQHREAIEANKFETIINAPAVSEENATADKEETPLKPEEQEISQEWAIHKVAADEVGAEKYPTETVIPVVEDSSDEDGWEDEEEQPQLSSKKLVAIWAVLLTIFVAILVGTFIWMNRDKKASEKPTETSQSSTTKSSVKKAESLSNFDTLYKTFFTDKTAKHLKNSQFEQLPNLKVALEKMDKKSEGYKNAKSQYDVLEKAIKAIQVLNNQFDKPVLVDGKLDETAKAKPDATFTAVTTGLSEVDALLTAAINKGRSQQTTTTVQETTQTTVAEITQIAPQETTPTTQNASNLQRNVSRVPYNQAAIDDVNNDAWNFIPGVLENILEISRQRGYFAGDDYILEKVNIINGNGYYNLFRGDGTYLFTINAKTGYFVGNGAGHADDLDY